MNVQKGKHQVGPAPAAYHHPPQRYAHEAYTLLRGPTENPGFHVSSGGPFPNQGAGVPAAGGQGSQQIRLSMHTPQTLPPQQVTHPQPPPTPTSTPPAADMGKAAQNNINYAQTTQRAQGSAPFYQRMNPQTNSRISTPRPIVPLQGVFNMPIAVQHPLYFPSSVSQIPTPAAQYQPQRQPTNQQFFPQAAGMQHIAYQSVIQSNSSQFFQTPPPSYFLQSSGNTGQYGTSVQIQRGFPGPTQSPMTISPAQPGPQPGMPHSSQPLLNQQASQHQISQRHKGKRGTKALAIIHPVTGKNILDEETDSSGENNNVTPPQSNDSSARETPQPECFNYFWPYYDGCSSHENEIHPPSEEEQVRAEFAAKVAAVATDSNKQTGSQPSIPEAVNGPDVAEAETNQSVPNSESVKISILSSSHGEEFPSIPQTSDLVKESTGHNPGLSIHSHGQPFQTPVVSALNEIPQNWPMNHTREPGPINHAKDTFSAFKNNTTPPTVSSPVKNNARKHPRVNSESEKNIQLEKLSQQSQAQLQPQQTSQPNTIAATNISVIPPVDHVPTTPVNVPGPGPGPGPVQKKDKNASIKSVPSNAIKDDSNQPVTSHHPSPKERRENKRSGKDISVQAQQQQQQQQPVHVNEQLEPAITHKPSFSESISLKSINQSCTSVSIPAMQTTVSVPTPVSTPTSAPVCEEKSAANLPQSQQTNGETPVEPSDAKASQRQSHKKKKMKDNRKGVEKEGTDMDAFTDNNQEEKEKSAPPAPAAVNSHPALSNKSTMAEKINKGELENIVAAKNEENTKVSALTKTEEENGPVPIIEKSQPPPQAQITLKHKYKEDQWSPLNPEGKKKYGREFLLDLQNEPQSMKKPDNLPNLEVVLHDHTNRRMNTPLNYPGSNRGSHDFVPTFLRSGQSLRGQITNRKSQQGSKGSKGSGKAPGIMHISLSLKDEVKLRETENAWRPARFNNAKDVTEEDKKTQELYKKVRSILNKLTPEKFETLVNQVKALPIDTPERLEGVINLVFDKAIDEPGFAKAYASMCKLVANVEVKVDEKATNGKGNLVFRKLLLTRCQSEFESNKAAELDSEKRLQEIKACTDPEKKKELQLNFEEEERQIRRKSVGNIRFIGELFKHEMLTAGIMHRCIQHLLNKHEEEPLECLCKLLTTIGKELETATLSANKDHQVPSLDVYFEKMQDLAQKRENSKISSRVRFMLQDVIDLKHNRWVPRRDDNNPKTIDQIQRDADRESMERSLVLSAPRKQEPRGGESKGRSRGGMNQNEEKDGWQVSQVKGYRSSHYSLEPLRMQSFKQQAEMTVSLGSALQYNTWGRGANTKSVDKSENRSITTNNMYSALVKERDTEKIKHSNFVRYSRSGKVTPSPSMEKERMILGFKEAMDSDKQSHRVQQSSQPPSRDRTPTPARATSASVSSTPASTLQPLTPEEIERKAKLIAEEFLYNKNYEEAQQSIEDIDRNVEDVLFGILSFVISKNEQTQATIGKLFADLIGNKFLSTSTVVNLFVKLCEQIVEEEWIIDIPLIWTYFAELLAPLVKYEKLSFAELRTICRPVPRDSKGFFMCLLKILIRDNGENWVRSKWTSSGVELSDFIEDVNNPDVKKQMEFLTRKGGDSTSLLTMDEVQKKLVIFLKSENMHLENIVEWINVHVGQRVKEPQFICALMTAVCETSITSNKKSLLEQFFKKNLNLIRRFVDSKEELEVQCLCAIQAYITKLEHPSGLLMTIFNNLWEVGLISNESFIKWRDTEGVKEGKGVAVKSLTSFFTVLNEGEISDEATS
ncbi:eukaryotic translation initiation factor 4 gamma 3-like isoform X3 [Lycorma delicatula]|uniref:eukaryotic translation initiation factor 4 gamma 3-like isoform X3 n=1 Tax=Lycorma delicatula TaxID=130591 RepID=UPI003F516013